jgi:hypothetical protein
MTYRAMSAWPYPEVRQRMQTLDLGGGAGGAAAGAAMAGAGGDDLAGLVRGGTRPLAEVGHRSY